MSAATATPETIKLLADLIQSQMSLKDDEVLLYNEKFKLPPEKGLRVAIQIVGDRPFGVNSKHRDPGTGLDLEEVITLNQQEVVQVDVYSYDSTARLRRIEVIYALCCDEAQRLQEKYGFQIGRIPPNFVDVSEVEASKRLNRYALTFNVLRAYERVATAETFVEFSQPQLYYNQ